VLDLAYNEKKDLFQRVFNTAEGRKVMHSLLVHIVTEMLPQDREGACRLYKHIENLLKPTKKIEKPFI
jgi:hypothetical protein